MILIVCLFLGNGSDTEQDMEATNECAETTAGKRLKNESFDDDSQIKPAAKKKKKVIISTDEDETDDDN